MRTVSITVDLENDYGQDHIQDRYCIDDFLASRDPEIFTEKHKITGFIVGELLPESPELVDVFHGFGGRLELHSYGHKINRDPMYDIPRAVEVFKEAVGHRPVGYRAPQGVLKKYELRVLYENGIKYSSSVFPSYRPGKFNNLGAKRTPFFYDNFPLMELPLGSIPVLRFPISLSYMMLFGWSFYKRLFDSLGLPENLVFMFHLHDLYKPPSYEFLSRFWRKIYGRIYSNDPLEHLFKFLSYLEDLGYGYMYLDELYELKLDELLERVSP